MELDRLQVHDNTQREFAAFVADVNGCAQVQNSKYAAFYAQGVVQILQILEFRQIHIAIIETISIFKGKYVILDLGFLEEGVSQFGAYIRSPAFVGEKIVSAINVGTEAGIGVCGDEDILEITGKIGPSLEQRIIEAEACGKRRVEFVPAVNIESIMIRPVFGTNTKRRLGADFVLTLLLSEQGEWQQGHG